MFSAGQIVYNLVVRHRMLILSVENRGIYILEDLITHQQVKARKSDLKWTQDAGRKSKGIVIEPKVLVSHRL